MENRELRASAILAGAIVSMCWTKASVGAYKFVDLYPMGTPSGLSTMFPSSFQSMAGGSIAGYGIADVSGNEHALFWSSAAPNGVDLNPAGFAMSQARGVFGSQQVGRALGTTTGGQYHAMTWSGSAASFVDLHPAGFAASAADDTDGVQQVGSAITSSLVQHAVSWLGTPESCVDLHPAGYLYSTALGLSESTQVGFARAPTNVNHAMLWTGSPESAVDLHPIGYSHSQANDASGPQQVGAANIGSEVHAMLWSGTAESVVDLDPVGFNNSVTLATNGQVQVGYGYSVGEPFRALAWTGTAESCVDLSVLLPPSFVSALAYDVDALGNIYGVARNSTGVNHAVTWQAVPEPSNCAALMVIRFGMLRLRPRRRFA